MRDLASHRRQLALATLAVLTLSAATGRLPALRGAAPALRGAAPAKAPKAQAPLTQEAQALHVLNRLGYGPRPGDVQRALEMGVGRYIDAQLNPATIDDSAVEAKLQRLPALRMTSAQLAGAYEYDRARQRLRARARAARAGEAAQPPASQAPAARARKLAANRDEALVAEGERLGLSQGISTRIVGEMQTARLVRAVESNRQLQEVLTDFWSNHFNVDVKKGPVRTLRLADEREVIRPHVLGRFRDMLGASARSPAMLFYLDNARSSRPVGEGERPRRRRQAAAPPKRARGGINENYARELMELHTLGVGGGYTEKDVQEVARCLTGWSFVPATGAFVFRPNAHDNGSKAVLGKSIPAGGGIRDGEMVLDLLASHPSTARHLSYKLCQRFVADSPPEALVQRGAKAYLQSGGDLRALTRAILTSPAFMSGQTMGGKIKSPYEYVVSAVRAVGGSLLVPDAAEPRGRLLLIADGQASVGRNAGAANARNRTLPRELARMGQPMFSCQPPTGYPETSSNWVSAGALVARLNFALALSSGSFAGVRASPPQADGGIEEMVRSESLNILGRELTPATREVIQKELAAGGAPAPEKVRALVLGSPEFQRR